MNTKKIILLLLIVSSSLMAELKEQWKINVGSMYVSQFETELQVDKKGLPVGTKINTKDQLGLESETAVFRVDGYYRFNKTHKIEFSYFGVNSNSNRSLDKEITWDGKVISAGATFKSYFNMKIYKLNYAYSFYHNEKVELALVAGFHITQVDLGYDAYGEIDGVASASSKGDMSATAPLPVVGFEGKYAIIPKTLLIAYEANYFYLTFDDYAGAITSSTLKMEYRFMEHIGLGIGYNINYIILDKDDGNRKIDVDNRLSGAIIYMSYTY
jgi:hypothetical protein